MIRIDDKTLCCGCGACATACPAGCIDMRRDEEGFLYPAVDAARCVGCGRCEQVCPIRRADEGRIVDTSARPEPFAAGGWHRDAAVRQASSSGGAFTLLADGILRQGGVVFGAAMDGHRVRHIAARDRSGLDPMRGSKYVQSEIGDAYRQAREALDAGKPVLFSGTPCQTAGLLSCLGGKREGLYLVDFICHGVPSPKVFEAYLDSVERHRGAKVVAFSFREKDKGWHPSGLQLGTRATLSDGSQIRRYPALRDSYMNGFLEDIYLRPSCYHCRFKAIPKWSADITIADFWGVDKALPEMNDGRGTSLILIHNDHGQALFDSVRGDFDHREVDWRRATVKNPTLIRSAKETPLRARFFSDFGAKGYDGVAGKYMSTPGTVVRKLSKIVAGKLKGGKT